MAVKLPCDDRPPTAVRCPSRNAARGVWVLAATILGSAMPGIDATAVNVALPVLQREMHAGSDATQWVVEAYSLLLSALILAGGSLGDRIGRRRVFVIGTCIFAISSLGCALSQTIDELIIARSIQGIGGALLVPESLALITASFDERRRGAAIGTWSGFLAATMALGPLLGGWLVQAASWRYVFLINLPIALIVVLITRKFVTESRDEEMNGRIDWAGAALATAALGSLTYGFISLQSTRSTYAGVGAVIAGAVLFAVFVAIEHRSSAPMVPMGIFASRDFTVANVYTFLLYAALGGGLFFVPFNLINVQHYSPFDAGAALLPMIVLMFVSSRWSGGLVAHIGARIPLTIGGIIAGVGFALFGFAGVGASYWSTFFPAVLVLGVGTSTFVAPLTTTVMNSAPAEHAGTASGINNAVSRVAGLLAIAVLGIVIVVTARGALQPDARNLPRPVQATLAMPASAHGAARNAITQAYEVGFRDAMLACAALAWAAAALAGTALRVKQPARR